MKIIDILNMSREQRDALTDDEIRDLAFGIKHYEPYGETREEAQRQMGIVLNELYPRVAALKPLPTQPRPQVEHVRCNCGHTVARNLVMSTSNGTSCPDCYDRMSN